MTRKERIFHMILFEALALILLFITARLLTDKPMATAGGLAVSLSFIAMAWNYVYNWVFDYLQGNDRHSRSLKVRIIHGSLFELGMVILSFPLIMIVLETDLITTFLMNIGLVLFFLLYAITFNWSYDMIKFKMTA